MKKAFPPVGAALFFLLALVVFDRQPGVADCRSFSELIRNGGYGVADREGRILSSCNGDTPFVPASIIKIPTALTALHLLGSGYRFVTEFFIDPDRNLYVRGYGDPFLVSEEVERIAITLRDLGIDRINGIFIDQGSYQLAEQVPGRGISDNPYDVPVTAVAVNFNTVSISVDKMRGIGSAEPQTPGLPIMQEMGRGLKPGTYRLNVCRQGCEPDERSARYTAELIGAKCREKGIVCTDLKGMRAVPEAAKLIYTHRNSRTLEEVVASFLRYSNNYVANQVFLVCGAVKFGFPATREKARMAMTEALAEIVRPDTAARTVMVEGAGLSRRNRITAEAMLDILHAFQPFAHLLTENNRAGVKSGTMAGVYNLAGYTRTGSPFVILLNQRENYRERILNRLEKDRERR